MDQAASPNTDILWSQPKCCEDTDMDWCFGYVLVVTIRKRLNLENLSLYNILQVLSVSPFCYDGLQQLFTDDKLQESEYNNPNQLSLFEL